MSKVARRRGQRAKVSRRNECYGSRYEFGARASRDFGLLPLPKGEGWGEGLQTIDNSEPPLSTTLPCGEREFRRAVVEVCAPLHGRGDDCDGHELVVGPRNRRRGDARRRLNPRRRC